MTDSKAAERIAFQARVIAMLRAALAQRDQKIEDLAGMLACANAELARLRPYAPVETAAPEPHLPLAEIAQAEPGPADEPRRAARPVVAWGIGAVFSWLLVGAVVLFALWAGSQPPDPSAVEARGEMEMEGGQ